MRFYFHVVFLIGNATRAVSLMFEFFFWDTGVCPSSMACTMARVFPNLPFLTAYSLLSLFWARLTHSILNLHAQPRLICLMWNATLYLLFFLFTTIAWSASRFECLVFYTLGFFYLSVLVLLIYYGVSTQFHLGSHMLGGRGSSPSSDPRLVNLLLWRVMTLCVISALFVSLNIVYFFLSAASDKQPFGFPNFIDHRLFDVFAYFLLELIPTLVLLRTLNHHSPANSPSPASPLVNRVNIHSIPPNNYSSNVYANSPYNSYPTENTGLLPMRPQPVRPVVPQDVSVSGYGNAHANDQRPTRPRPNNTATSPILAFQVHHPVPNRAPPPDLIRPHPRNLAHESQPPTGFPA